MYTCEFCGKILTNAGGFAAHKKRCKQNPEYVAPKKVACDYCGKYFYEGPAISNHSAHCNHNPERTSRKAYDTSSDYFSESAINCKYCGKELKNRSGLVQHELRCSKNPDRIPVNDFKLMYQKYSDDTKARMNWNKGLTKADHESILQYSEKLLGRSTGPLSNEVKEQISLTRIKKIQDGTITPGYGKGYVVSKIQYLDGKQKVLRSSYELIIAIFLDYCGISFEYEDIRVPYIGDDGKQHNFISDFSIGSNILEIKGYVDSVKLKKEVETFTNLGYTIKVLYENDINHIKDLLRDVCPIDDIIKEAKEKSKSKEYYTYYLHI